MFNGRLNLQSLQTRSVSAAVMIAVVVTILIVGGIPFIALLGLLAAVSLYEWAQLALKCEKPVSIIYLVAGVPYVMGSFLCCFVIFESIGFFWSIIFLMMVWVSDSGAYFAGKTIGGPKMAARISPNKTWAGFGGAILSPAFIGVVAMFLYRGVDDFSLVALMMMGISGVFIGAAGQVGDLVISAFKRKAGVKDTGTLIPGHGGLLDRVDSMLLAAPVYLMLFAYGHG
ncbi:MAG: phosphatidate cytidylyltransferase [Alphaproteobacteria bacterium]|nr:phosphatidate cytidylyltransferase [Alphaproteobacteria bacterium]